MLWGCIISWKGRTKLVEVIERITGDLYIENILQEMFVFMCGNAGQHSVGMVIKFLHVARLKSNRGYVESGQYIISF